MTALLCVLPAPASAGGSGWSQDPVRRQAGSEAQVPQTGAFAFGKTHAGGVLPVRWNPCGGPIRVSLAGAAWEDGHGRALRYAVRRLRSATGLPLRLDPARLAGFDPVAWDPRSVADRGATGQQGQRGIVVSVGSAPHDHPGALGTGRWFSRGGRSGEWLVAGLVHIDAVASAGLPRQWRAAMYMHELGHVIGLSHVSDQRQIMYPTIVQPSGPTAAAAMPEWGAGDLRGLELLGSTAGCPASNPAAVRVQRVEVVRSSAGRRGRIVLRWRGEPLADAFRIRIATQGSTGRWRFTTANRRTFRGLRPGRYVVQVRAVVSGVWGPVTTRRTRL